ncbi:MAG TPA: pitrilysin family protein [Polyangiaceae bacterium]|nr:pitrilysin family protein [Polyangiaceae bacterium]
MSAADMEPQVLVEASTALPLVTVTVAERTGAVDDPEGKEGLSRLAARLVRRTGDGLPTEELDEKIDSLGASLSVDVGQSTCQFHGTVIGRSLERFSDLVVAVLSRPSLSGEELGKLKRETLADLVEARENDRDLAQKWFRKTLFAGHLYGRSVSGTPASIASISDADVRSHVAGTLAAKNLVFAFSGDVDETTARALATRIAGALPPGEARVDRVPEPAPLPKGRKLVLVDKPDRTQTQIYIGCLGTHPHDEDHVALHVGNTIFGGTFTARLMKEVRSKRGWSYGAYSNLPYDRRRRGFSLWTFPKADDAAPCIALELSLLEKWVEGGITPRELAWAKRYLVRSHAFAVDTAAKRLAQRLDEVLYGLPPGYHSEYLERVQAVTVEDVNAAIRKRITPEDLVITVLGTAKDVLVPIRTAIGHLTSEEIVPFDRDD